MCWHRSGTERRRLPEMQSPRRPSQMKAWRCFSMKASSDIGGRPPIVSIRLLVPAKMPFWWSARHLADVLQEERLLALARLRLLQFAVSGPGVGLT